MSFPHPRTFFPNAKSCAAAIFSAVLLIFAFPNFEFGVLAWFGLIPLLWAVEREKTSIVKSFAVGWLFGVCFFFGTCWWLTFAPITYAAFPPVLAYFLFFGVAAVAGLFPALFAGVFAAVLRRFGSFGIVSAPFIWTATEFLRYWLTGNNWNAIAYSQAFSLYEEIFRSITVGGIYLAGFYLLACNSFLFSLIHFVLRGRHDWGDDRRVIEPLLGFISPLAGLLWWGLFGWLAFRRNGKNPLRDFAVAVPVAVSVAFSASIYFLSSDNEPPPSGEIAARAVAVQPNVPMSGLTPDLWSSLRLKHVRLAEAALSEIKDRGSVPVTVLFPESPMNFMFEEDREFQRFIGDFAARNNVNVLFNSAEPDSTNNKYFNSAVLVDTQGREIAQYDKIYLLPFGESVPWPLRAVIPAFVGSFSYGREYDLLPMGYARAGVVICFESHFGELSRRYVNDGADALIEMTNDGYLGPTPILRQHLANAVFRAVETNRPLLRVTNVGVTAYVNQRGEVINPAETYTEATRIWNVYKSDGSKTFYVKYGEWFAWLCTLVTLLLVGLSLRRRPDLTDTDRTEPQPAHS